MHVKASFVDALIMFIEFLRLGFDALIERLILLMILHMLTSLGGEQLEPVVK